MKRLQPIALTIRERMVVMTEHLQAILDWPQLAREVLLQEHDEEGRHKLPWHAKGFIRANTGGPGVAPAILEGSSNLQITRLGVGQVAIVAPPSVPWPNTVYAIPFFATAGVPGVDAHARVALSIAPINRGLIVQRRVFARMAGAVWHTYEDGELALGLYGEW